MKNAVDIFLGLLLINFMKIFIKISTAVT